MWAAGIVILIMWALFGFHWIEIFLALAVGALVDIWTGYERVDQPKVKTKTTYERKPGK
jgi:hypothetical protein